MAPLAPHGGVSDPMGNAQPLIILVRPQLGENIGKAARAMLNFGLTEMRIVAPRDGWPNPAAGPSAAGADVVLDNATLFETLEDALADCTMVYATTVRDRHMPKPVVTPAEAAAEMRLLSKSEGRVGILFGPERSGLTNDDVALADMVLTVPVNKSFSSLNLAQAVVLIAYEYFKDVDDTPHYIPAHPEGLAPKKELINLMESLEKKLDERGYFRSEGRRDTQRRMLRNLIQNMDLSSQEAATLRGVIKSLTTGRPLSD